MSINLKHEFPTLVVGDSNQYAHNICQNLIKNLSTNQKQEAKISENKFQVFIYGDEGNGKSHLLNTINKKFREKNPELHIVFKTCENMMYELIQFIKNNLYSKFIEKYCSCDVLIIEDM